MDEAKERDYKAEYKKFQSSTKSKKYRAELNKYNRKKGTYGNGDGKDASHQGGKIVGFESQSKNRGRAEKSRLKQESLIYEIPASVFSAAAAVKLKNKAGKEVSAATAAKSDYAKKDPATHKKAKSIFQRLKDKFAKKKDEKPKKQSKSDADFYKRQYAGESVNEAGNVPMAGAAMKKVLTEYEKLTNDWYNEMQDLGVVQYDLVFHLEKNGFSHHKMIKRYVDPHVKKAKQEMGKIHRNLTQLMQKHVGESVNEAENKIADIRMILKTKKGKRIDSIFMDVKTAEEVMKHYKSLGRGAKERLVKQKIQNIVKSVKKANESVNEANQTAMYTQTFDKLLKKQTKGKQPTLKDLDRVYDLMRKRYKELDSRKYESINESWNQLRTTLVNIVRRKQYKKIDGVMVDMQTANLILKVWDALNSSNKSKFEKLPIKQMANVAWKLMK